MKECTFQPNNYKKKKSPVLSNIVTQNLYQLKQQRRDRNRASKEYEEQQAECTFQPVITKYTGAIPDERKLHAARPSLETPAAINRR